MSDDGREETFAEEDNFIPVTVVLVLLIVIATVIIVFCILKTTPDLEAQEGQAQIPLRTRLRRLPEYVGTYFNVGDSNAPVWDSGRPIGPLSQYGTIRSQPEADVEANRGAYYTLAVDQSESS